MARQKHAKRSLFDALGSALRRARTSLYQPFAEPPPAAASMAAPAQRSAKVIPFPAAPPHPAPAPAKPRVYSTSFHG
jgi:hypothetical protein